LNRINNLVHFTLIALILAGSGLANSKVIKDIPKVYLDGWFCDSDYIRTEIPYVDYVWERRESDIHILITQQRTGGDGREFTLTFVGQNYFTGINDTLVFISYKTDTEDNIRKEMVRVVKLGLVQYISKTSMAKNLSISYIQPKEEIPQKAKDKWNNWIFSIGFHSFMNGQESTNSTSLWGFLNTKRVTEEWKIELSTHGSYKEDNFDFDGSTYRSISRSRSFNASIVKSLTNHWSVGIKSYIYSSTYSNIDIGLTVFPGIEYNFFPYSESTRRQLRLIHSIAPKYLGYSEETIYLKFNDKLLEESFSINLELIQTWGSIDANLSASHYFHDIKKNNVQLYGSLSLKVIKGLSLDLYGRVSMIHDQLSLPRSGSTLEEVLLRRKQLATQYNYWFSIGLSYSFGSIYSTVVNPRFSNW